MRVFVTREEVHVVALVILTLGTAGFLAHWHLRGREWTVRERWEHATRWWLGAMGAFLLVAGFGHLFRADEIAESIGWPVGSPFQREIGFTDVAWGVLGLVAVRARGSFREAFALGTLIFLWGAAGGHVYEMVANDNTAPNNSGMMLYMDIIAPIISVVVLWRLRVEERRAGASAPVRPGDMPARAVAD
jgi:uncharacterized membrane protein HdeD (DUF308 family)